MQSLLRDRLTPGNGSGCTFSSGGCSIPCRPGTRRAPGGPGALSPTRETRELLGRRSGGRRLGGLDPHHGLVLALVVVQANQRDLVAGLVVGQAGERLALDRNRLVVRVALDGEG